MTSRELINDDHNLMRSLSENPEVPSDSWIVLRRFMKNDTQKHEWYE
jgi:hypothetical protein